jgi:hypothetical protein
VKPAVALTHAVVGAGALVMLAPMRLPPDAPGVPSVLSLFDGNTRPPGLSQWDRAFLKGLYAMQMNRSAQRQRQQLISAMVRELAADAPTPPQ